MAPYHVTMNTITVAGVTYTIMGVWHTNQMSVVNLRRTDAPPCPLDAMLDWVATYTMSVRVKARDAGPDWGMVRQLPSPMDADDPRMPTLRRIVSQVVRDKR